MKILIVKTPQSDGCTYHRIENPHYFLHKNHGVEIVYTDTLRRVSAENLKEFDFVLMHCGYFSFEEVNRCKLLGVKIVVDFDDYWVLPIEHPLRRHYVSNGMPARMVELLKKVDYVLCSTFELQLKIEFLNKKVFTIANGLNLVKQKNERTPAMPLRFGYFGSATHTPDLKQYLQNVINILDADFKGKYEFHLFGYNKSKVYNEYVSILCGNSKSDSLKLIPAVNVFRYLDLYETIDVAIAPLCDNEFNHCKSNLKVIEAGVYGKPIICSDVKPYNEIIKDKLGFQSGFLCRNRADFVSEMKNCIVNYKELQFISKELQTIVYKKFNLTAITAKRFEIYQQIVNN